MDKPMNQTNTDKTMPPDPPDTPDEWAQVVADKVSNTEMDEDSSIEDADYLDGVDESEPETSSDEVFIEGEIIEDYEPASQSLGSDESEEVKTLIAQRDQYLDASRRVQAEFENYRKQVGKRESEARARANENLVSEILPVLDACDGAVANGADDVKPIRTALLDSLTKQGLERLDPIDQDFDPELHEAVMHEESESDEGARVIEVLRAGYQWKGRVVRPAMVRVKG